MTHASGASKEAGPVRRERSPMTRRLAGAYLMRYATVLVLVIPVIYFSFAADYFFTVGNLRSIVKEWTILGTLALGFTFVAAVGEFDLSFGYLVALASVTVALLLNTGIHWVLAVLAALGVGAVVGALNGLLIIRVGLPAFIATIGVGAMCQGTNYLFSRAEPIPIPYGALPSALVYVGQESILRLPATLIVFVPLAVLAIYILTQTRLGRHVCAVGASLAAARKAGISVKWEKQFAFLCSGLAAVIVGVLITCRTGSGQPIAGPEYLLDVFASVFFGMSLFREGEPNAEGSLVGAFFMVLLLNGLTLLNIAFYVHKIFQGIVILLGVGATSIRQTRMQAQR